MPCRRLVPDQALRRGGTAGPRPLPVAGAAPMPAERRRQYSSSGKSALDMGKRTVERNGQPLHPDTHRIPSADGIDRPTPTASSPTRQLLKTVWGPSHAEDSHYVRVYMGHLRRKLEMIFAAATHRHRSRRRATDSWRSERGYRLSGSAARTAHHGFSVRHPPLAANIGSQFSAHGAVPRYAGCGRRHPSRPARGQAWPRRKRRFGWPF